eukprot:292479-Karenia_brevis.AAC.1
MEGTYFYNGALESQKGHYKRHQLLPGFAWPQDQPLAFVHVEGQEKWNRRSWENKKEVTYIADLIQSFLRGGSLRAQDICVISPYQAQVQLLTRYIAA